MDAHVPQRLRVRNTGEIMAEEPKFEESLARLEKLVSEMEHGNLSLDNMMKHFEEGRKLVGTCTKELESIRQRIEKVVTSTTPPAVEPLDIL